MVIRFKWLMIHHPLHIPSNLHTKYVKSTFKRSYRYIIYITHVPQRIVIHFNMCSDMIVMWIIISVHAYVSDGAWNSGKRDVLWFTRRLRASNRFSQANTYQWKWLQVFFVHFFTNVCICTSHTVSRIRWHCAIFSIHFQRPLIKFDVRYIDQITGFSPNSTWKSITLAIQVKGLYSYMWIIRSSKTDTTWANAVI